MVKPIIFNEEYQQISVIVLIEQRKMINTEKIKYAIIRNDFKN